MASSTGSRPPRQILLAQLTVPLRNFLLTEAGSPLLLLAATIAGLVWANSPWSDSYESLWATDVAVRVGGYELSMHLDHWVSDGLMALFFFVIGLELRREISVGELREPRSIVIPALAAVGGLVIPALLYLLINPAGEASNGWGVVIGTDTAFLLGAVALVGPSLSTQLRVFLLTITIIDDILAVAIIGAIYTESIDLGALALAAACLGAFVLLGRLQVWRTFAYALVGLVLWVATVESGLHTSIAGMAAGLLVAAHPPRRAAIDQATALFRAFRQSPLPSLGYSAKQGIERTTSVNERLQESLHPLTSYLIVPLFALANAGIDLRGGLLQEALQSPVTWGVVLGLVAGKPIGIGLATVLSVRLRFGSVLRGIGPGQVLGGGALSGIGFTVSLLIVRLAFTSSDLQDQATVGVFIAAILSVLTGWLTFKLAAVLNDEHTATLPLVLDQPIDPARDHIRGRVDAPLTLIEYGDFECPFCSAATGAVRDLRERFGDDLRYVFRHLPLPDVHPRAELAAQASEIAAAGGKFWEMHDLLFQRQDQLEFEDLIGYASKVGLDVEKFTRDLEESRFAERVREDVVSAEASGARSTPTFFVGNHRHVGPYDAETLTRELNASRISSLADLPES